MDEPGPARDTPDDSGIGLANDWQANGWQANGWQANGWQADRYAEHGWSCSSLSVSHSLVSHSLVNHSFASHPIPLPILLPPKRTRTRGGSLGVGAHGEPDFGDLTSRIQALATVEISERELELRTQPFTPRD